MKLSKREHATLRAAVRFLQKHQDMVEADVEIMHLATGAGNWSPLDDEELQFLFEDVLFPDNDDLVEDE